VRTPWFVFALVLAAMACGPSPSAPEGPSGTLVVVVRQGPDRVPFQPKVARIQRANQQLTNLLGHSIQIELDGSLLPQTHDGAQDVIARLVESVVGDLDALQKEDKGAFELARARFERLVVRYAPAEAAEREGGWRRKNGARFDPSTKTIDVTRAEARWLALERSEIATVIYDAYAAGVEARYAEVLPDALPRAEHRSWFDYHAHGRHSSSRAQSSGVLVGSVHGLRVRGMVMLHALASRSNDEALAKDVRKWLVNAASDFAGTYHHHAAEVEGAAAGSSYRLAESAWTGWVRSELPQMTLEEKGKIASHLFVIDFRKSDKDRDRFASYAFPGIDPMAFSFDAVDAWIAAGHPTSRSVPEYFDRTVCPAVVSNDHGGPHFSHPGSCAGDFYRWSLADRAREDQLVKGVIARKDTPFAATVFYNARRTLREEPDYLRFLRRFESAPQLWAVGADVHRDVVFRPSTTLLEESRRLWRELPAARGHVFFWFTRHIDGSYHPQEDWPDLLQGKAADQATLGAYLDLGWPAFELLPAAWAGLERGKGRVQLVTTRAKALFAEDVHARPGGRGVAGTLASIARILCDERSLGELAELRAFAQAELSRHPGEGLSDAVEASDPSKCVPKREPTRPAISKKPTRPGPPKRPEKDVDSPW
jgi:hypothetical protein